MMRPAPLPAKPSPDQKLRWLIPASQAALFAEALWPVLVAPLCVVSLFLSASWLGLWDFVPPYVRLSAVALWALAFLWSALPLRHVLWPSRSEAIARLEAENDLNHTPINSYLDTQGTNTQDPLAQALWTAHHQRAEASLTHLKPTIPRPTARPHDRNGLRYACALIFVVAALAGWRDPLGPILAAMEWPQGPITPVRIDAYITPPDYTGQRPALVDLKATSPLVVPEGSKLDVHISGLAAPKVAFADKDLSASPTSTATSTTVTTTIATNGTLNIMAGWKSYGARAFTLVMDTPPSIRLLGPLSVTSRGSLHLAYEATDDYGVASAQAQFLQPQTSGQHTGQNLGRPLYDPPKFPLSLGKRGPGTAKGETTKDLTAHPFVGARLPLLLTATDAKGQTAISEPTLVTLPQRMFHNPVAKALIEQRRALAMDAERQADVAGMIFALLQYPDEHLQDVKAFISLADTLFQLERARSEDDLRAVVDQLWQIAVALDGDSHVQDSAERLRQAREALKSAIERGAPPEEIARLAQEAKKALNDYLSALAQKPQTGKEPNTQVPNPNARKITSQDLQKMLDKAQELARLGDRQAAQKLLDQLDDLLENMQTAPQSDASSDKSDAAKTLDKLSDVIKKQQQLRQKTYRQSPQGKQAQNQDQRNQDPNADEKALSDLEQAQKDLKDQLDQTMEDLKAQGIDPDKALSDAQKSMEEAQKSLKSGDSGQAVDDQGQALENLRKGAKNTASQMGQGGQNGQGQSQQGKGGKQDGNPDEDPLARGRQTPDQLKGGIPSEFDMERARRILEELRKRSGETTRPKPELDYLDRLLKQ